MAFNFFRKNKTKSKDQVSYDLLVKFLVNQISSPAQVSGLVEETKDFLKLDKSSQDKEIVRLYLLFQQYCCHVDSVQKISEKALKNKVLVKFPWLAANLNARVVFKPEKEANLLMGSLYLKQILGPVKEIAGSRKGNVLEDYIEWVDQIWQENYFIEIDLNGLQTSIHKEINYADLISLSKIIYADLSEKFGQSNIETLYQRAYKKTKPILKDSSSFPLIIELMPVQILQPEHLSILGQSEIHKILLSQVSELESLNRKISREAEENKALTKVLKYKSDALESILKGTLNAVIVINEEGIVNYWNSESEKTFGFSEKEAIGFYLSDLIIPKMHRENHVKGMRRYMSSGISTILNQTIEIDALHKSGKGFPIELSISESKDNGEISFIAFARDISQQKKYESTLIEAKQQAEETARFKSRFFANMSHEIRTPLNAIIGFTNLLLEQKITQEQKEYLNLIETSGNNLMSILNDILEISKIEEGKLQLNPKAENFAKSVSNILAPYQVITQEKGLSYILEFEKDFPTIISLDYHRFGQVLVNLISNAAKFTNEGGIRVYFEYDFKKEGEIIIKATVSDSGKGVNKDNLNKIFESFQQEDGGIAREFGGTGLGLSISREIAVAMGGTLNVLSPSAHFNDKGSDFIVEIAGTLSTKISKKEPEAKPARPDFTGEGIEALLVEDNPVNQKLLTTVLTHMGLDITAAFNGIEALEILSKRDFDIIFMDIQMPELDGFETTKQARERNIETPIVAISANVYPEDIEKSLESGMQAHIGKPFNLDELKKVIDKYVTKTV